MDPCNPDSVLGLASAHAAEPDVVPLLLCNMHIVKLPLDITNTLIILDIQVDCHRSVFSSNRCSRPITKLFLFMFNV